MQGIAASGQLIGAACVRAQWFAAGLLPVCI